MTTTHKFPTQDCEGGEDEVECQRLLPAPGQGPQLVLVEEPYLDIGVLVVVERIIRIDDRDGWFRAMFRNEDVAVLRIFLNLVLNIFVRCLYNSVKCKSSFVCFYTEVDTGGTSGEHVPPP